MSTILFFSASLTRSVTANCFPPPDFLAPLEMLDLRLDPEPSWPDPVLEERVLTMLALILMFPVDEGGLHVGVLVVLVLCDGAVKERLYTSVSIVRYLGNNFRDFRCISGVSDTPLLL